jgi:hypothetical protein
MTFTDSILLIWVVCICINIIFEIFHIKKEKIFTIQDLMIFLILRIILSPGGALMYIIDYLSKFNINWNKPLIDLNKK